MHDKQRKCYWPSQDNEEKTSDRYDGKTNVSRDADVKL